MPLKAINCRNLVVTNMSSVTGNPLNWTGKTVAKAVTTDSCKDLKCLWTNVKREIYPQGLSKSCSPQLVMYPNVGHCHVEFLLSIKVRNFSFSSLSSWFSSVSLDIVSFNVWTSLFTTLRRSDLIWVICSCKEMEQYKSIFFRSYI